MLDLVERYKRQTSTNKVDVEHLKEWLEDIVGKPMNRPLVYVGGKGGGQRYKLFYDVWFIESSLGVKCYYIADVNDSILAPLALAHSSLEEWLT